MENNEPRLADHFEWIYNNNESGTLKIQTTGSTRYIYFQNGFVQLVSSPQGKSVLGEGLRCCRGIDERTIEAIFTRQRETGQSLVSVLKEFNLGEKTFIADLLLFQIAEEIYEIFSWPNPECEFIEGPAPIDIFDPELLKLNVALDSSTLMIQAARRIDELRKIMSNFTDKDVPYTLVKGWQNEELPEEAKDVLYFTDGTHDVEEILNYARLPKFHGLKLISDMAERGLIAFRTSKELIQLASLDAIRTQVDKCRKLYERAEELGETSVDITTWLAVTYESCGHKEKAALQYKKLGEHCIQVGLTSGAIRAYKKVIEFTPDDHQTNETLIELLAESQRDEEAAYYSHLYARQLILTGDKKKASEVLELACKRCFLVDNLALLAPLYMELGENKSAIKVYSELAEYYEGQGDAQRTLDIYHKIITLDRDNVNARLALAQHYENQGASQEVLEQYKCVGEILSRDEKVDPALLIQVSKRIIGQEPYNLASRGWLIDSLIKSKNNSEAMVHIQEMISMLEKGDPDDPLIVENLKKVLEIEPQNNDYRKKLAELYDRKGMKNEAVQEYLNYAANTAKHSDFDNSIWALDKVISIEPHNLKARSRRAKIFFDLGDLEKAFKEYKLVGYLCKGSSMYNAAIDAFVKVLKIKPNQEQQWYLEIGEVYHELGNIDRAVQSYQKYAKRSLTQYNLGEAFQTCQRILTLAPQDEQALQMKAEAEQKIQLLGGSISAASQVESSIQIGTGVSNTSESVEGKVPSPVPAALMSQPPSPLPQQTPLPQQGLSVPTEDNPFAGIFSPPQTTPLSVPTPVPKGGTPMPGVTSSPLDSKHTTPTPLSIPSLDAGSPPGLSPLTWMPPSPPESQQATTPLSLDLSSNAPPDMQPLASPLSPQITPPGSVSSSLGFVDEEVPSTPQIIRQVSDFAQDNKRGKQQKVVRVKEPVKKDKEPGQPSKSSKGALVGLLIFLILLIAAYATYNYSGLFEKKTRVAPPRDYPREKLNKILEDYQIHPDMWQKCVEDLKKLAQETQNSEIATQAKQKAEDIEREKKIEEETKIFNERVNDIRKLLDKEDFLQVCKSLDEISKGLSENFEKDISRLKDEIAQKVRQLWNSKKSQITKLIQSKEHSKAIALIHDYKNNDIKKICKEIEPDINKIQNEIQYNELLSSLGQTIFLVLGNRDYSTAQKELDSMIKDQKDKGMLDSLQEIKDKIHQEEALLQSFTDHLKNLVNKKVSFTVGKDKIEGILIYYSKGILYVQVKTGKASFKEDEISESDINNLLKESISASDYAHLLIALGYNVKDLTKDFEGKEGIFFKERLVWSLCYKAIEIIRKGEMEKGEKSLITIADEFSQTNFVSSGMPGVSKILLDIAGEAQKSGDSAKSDKIKQILKKLEERTKK